MKEPLSNRTAFVVLALLGSPALVWGSVWALDGLGLDTTQFSLGIYLALIVGLPALYIVLLGRATMRTTTEIAIVMVVAAATTFLLAALLVAYALSHADLN